MKVYWAACLTCLLIGITMTDAQKFLSQQYASQFLLRKRRANTLFEETKAGNLERECIEELCNKEEAREIFENDSETEYFYPMYLACLGSHRAGISRPASLTSDGPVDLRSCITVITDQCKPLPCHTDGYQECKDGKASYTCICKPGWDGKKCEEDINECLDPENPYGGCSQKCVNLAGSYQCLCEDGYNLSSNKRSCKDINECGLHQDICGSAQCKNTPGAYICECRKGYQYNLISKSCEDIDECSENACDQICVNAPGSYSCYCDGKKGFKLAKDLKSCEVVPVCVPLDFEKNFELLYLAEQSTGIPVVYLKYRLPEVTRFSAEFDFRTYDAEGVILYAESPDGFSWFLLALRDGKIEIQFKNEHGTKVTSGGKVINDGQWHIVSVEELENSVSVKLAKEAIMNINSPGNLFKPIHGFLETKVYIAGVPRKVNSLIKPINPRLDGCIRGWNLMRQGDSGVKEVIQEKKSKHCLVTVDRGSYYPGSGFAKFQLNYNNSGSDEGWLVNVTLNIRPSTGTGVLFALVNDDTVPLALSVEHSLSDNVENLLVTVENVTVARLHSKRLCTNKILLVQLKVNRKLVELSAYSHSNITYSDKAELEQQLFILDNAMKGQIETYLGGLPDVPVTASPVNAYYNGCMDVTVNSIPLDLDEALFKQNDIHSHSCPLVL
ncbi:vitamin K-dependent protein S [Microcaecilia unicolor]|uniref:Vitamin K-dependent protein S n=1 Tax=Microcaecilia unicolor TaxID=1415580 RepID=A0A6P7YAQ5_9AMPH|nr:vitamin K-dependent protein S [Microcaecilia unicolor]